MTVVPEEKDIELLERVSEYVHDGLDETSAIEMFADLTRSDCERLIAIFSEDELSGLSPEISEKIVVLLERLRDAKRA